MIVEIRNKWNDTITEYKDVCNFWFSRVRFYLKFKNGDRTTIWRRNCDLNRIREEEKQENGIQWHDLRKDPKDTPKKNGEYWVCYEDSVNIGHLGYELWIFINGKWNYTAKVAAWCELPGFKK